MSLGVAETTGTGYLGGERPSRKRTSARSSASITWSCTSATRKQSAAWYCHVFRLRVHRGPRSGDRRAGLRVLPRRTGRHPAPVDQRSPLVASRRAFGAPARRFGRGHRAVRAGRGTPRSMPPWRGAPRWPRRRRRPRTSTAGSATRRSAFTATASFSSSIARGYGGVFGPGFRPAPVIPGAAAGRDCWPGRDRPPGGPTSSWGG